MVSVFKDPDLQDQFDREGFLKIKLFDAEKIKKLLDYYLTVQKDHHKAINMRCLYSTVETGDARLIADVDRLVKETIIEEVSQVLINFYPLISTYLVKASGDDTELHPHQDLTFVDEPQYCSLNVWIPLQRTDNRTGQLRVVKGSHKIQKTLRVTPSYPWPFDEYSGLFRRLSTEIETEPGDCVMLNHAVIHGSAANMAENERVAVIMGVCSDPTVNYYYHMRGGDNSRIEKYLMEPDMYYDLDKDGRPARAKLLQYVSHDFKPVSEKTMKEWIRTDPNFTVWDRWKLLYFTQLKEKK